MYVFICSLTVLICSDDGPVDRRSATLGSSFWICTRFAFNSACSKRYSAFEGWEEELGFLANFGQHRYKTMPTVCEWRDTDLAYVGCRMIGGLPQQSVHHPRFALTHREISVGRIYEQL